MMLRMLLLLLLLFSLLLLLWLFRGQEDIADERRLRLNDGRDIDDGWEIDAGLRFDGWRRSADGGLR